MLDSFKLGTSPHVMDYNQLGRTGIKVSQLGLGTMNFGERVNAEVAFDILNKAQDIGINLIDTADIYGRSEEIVGQWLEQSGMKEELIISTKVGWPVGDGPNQSGLSRSHIQKQIRSSLNHLKISTIDIYQPHYLDNKINITDVVRTFSQLVDEHLVHLIGAPIFTKPYQLVRWYYEAKSQDLHNVSLRQLVLSLVSRSMDTTSIPEIGQLLDVPLISFAPIGGGLLTGKYQSSFEFPANGRKNFEKIHASGKADTISEVLETISKNHGVTPAHVSLAWVLNHDYLTSTILGVSSPSQLEDILTATELHLSKDDLEQLSQVSEAHRIW